MNYSTKSNGRRHLDFADRERLGRKWNSRVNGLDYSLSINSFAKENGISPKLWRRELKRGCIGDYVTFDTLHKRRDNKHVKDKFDYGNYDPKRAQAVADELKRNKGPRQKLTANIANEFSRIVKDERRSPYHAREELKRSHPDKVIPSLSTFYNYIKSGQIGVQYGETPYHPGRKRKKPDKAHPARTVPGRNQLSMRPEEANLRSELGHLEMDTIVSCSRGSGGLLVFVDRLSRYYYLEYIPHISQKCVIRAIRKMIKEKHFKVIRSVTTDNGTEFLDQDILQKVLGCKVYYTRAYASYEKGSIENANKMVRRWYPKGTNFAKVSKENLRLLPIWINTTIRKVLGNRSAYEVNNLIA